MINKKNQTQSRSKTQKIYKSPEINKANFGSFTLNQYQVFLHLVSKLGWIDKRGKYIQPNILVREHTLTAKEFSKEFKINLSSAYEVLKASVDVLFKEDIKVLNFRTKKITRINLCSSAEYYENEGKIVIKFTDDILPHLKQVTDKFVLYNLQEIANFRSLYAVRLYELIVEFSFSGWIHKSIDELRNILGIEQNKLKKYSHFKELALNTAVDQINKHHNINLKFEEIKKDRKITAIKFTFDKKNKTKQIIEEQKQMIIL